MSMSNSRHDLADLELVEQQVTLTLQEIDAEFVRGREIAADILGQARKYVAHVRDLHESVAIWNQFFDLMNVPAPNRAAQSTSIGATYQSQTNEQLRDTVSDHGNNVWPDGKAQTHAHSNMHTNTHTNTHTHTRPNTHNESHSDVYDSTHTTDDSGDDVVMGGLKEAIVTDIDARSDCPSDAGVTQLKPSALERPSRPPVGIDAESPSVGTLFDSPLRTTRVFDTPFALSSHKATTHRHTSTHKNAYEEINPTESDVNSLDIKGVTLDMDKEADDDTEDEEAADNVTTFISLAPGSTDSRASSHSTHAYNNHANSEFKGKLTFKRIGDSGRKYTQDSESKVDANPSAGNSADPARPFAFAVPLPKNAITHDTSNSTQIPEARNRTHGSNIPEDVHTEDTYTDKLRTSSNDTGIQETILKTHAETNSHVQLYDSDRGGLDSEDSVGCSPTRTIKMMPTPQKTDSALISGPDIQEPVRDAADMDVSLDKENDVNSPNTRYTEQARAHVHTATKALLDTFRQATLGATGSLKSVSEGLASGQRTDTLSIVARAEIGEGIAIDGSSGVDAYRQDVYSNNKGTKADADPNIGAYSNADRSPDAKEKGAYAAEDILKHTADEIPMHTAEETNADSEESTDELETPAFIRNNPRLSRYGGRQSVGPVDIAGAHSRDETQPKSQTQIHTKTHASTLPTSVGLAQLHSAAKTHTHSQHVATNLMRGHADGMVSTTTKVNVIATDTLGVGGSSAATALNQDQVTGSDTNDPMADGSDGDGEPDVEFKIELFPISYQTGSAKDELWAVWSLFWEDSESDNARSYTMESLRTRFPNFAPDGLRLIINMLKERSLIGEVLQGGAFAYHLA